MEWCLFFMGIFVFKSLQWKGFSFFDAHISEIQKNYFCAYFSDVLQRFTWTQFIEMNLNSSWFTDCACFFLKHYRPILVASDAALAAKRCLYIYHASYHVTLACQLVIINFSYPGQIMLSHVGIVINLMWACI